jgi:small subunit ribosomal protein S7
VIAMAKDEKEEKATSKEAKPKVEKKAPKKPAAKAKAAPKAKKEAPKKAPKKAEAKADKKPAAKAKAAPKAKKETPKKAAAKADKKPKAASKAKKKPAAKAPAKGPAKKPTDKADVDEKAKEEAKEKPAAPKKKAPKKPSKKKEAEATEAAPEGEVVEAVDTKTDKKISITIKPLFGKYSFGGIVVPNPGLQRYINIEPVSIPHTGARHANRPFAKQHMNIVERLINGMMRSEHGTGQKAKMYRVVEEAFDIIERRTKENPIQVYIDALCNSAPKEEVTRLRYGGINVPKAVDVSASRRLDIALRNVCKGAVNSSHKSRKRLPQTLADEIIMASKRDINSFAVSKKEEIERISASAR